MGILTVYIRAVFCWLLDTAFLLFVSLLMLFFLLLLLFVVRFERCVSDFQTILVDGVSDLLMLALTLCYTLDSYVDFNCGCWCYLLFAG
jgi:hypothetical protein